VSTKTGSGNIRVRRVILPRYEVQYSSPDYALKHAQSVKRERLFSLETRLAEPVGQEVVLDFCVDNIAMSTTLLFRIIQNVEDATIVEWWPRRTMDPDLLDLWIDGLSQDQKAGVLDPQASVAQAELLKLHALCRRALAGNPFVALDIHWSATGEEVETAFGEATSLLQRFRNSPQSDGNRERYILKARDGLINARSSLITLEDRQALRRKLVPKEQLEHARGVAGHRVEVARLQGETEKQAHARNLLRELMF